MSKRLLILTNALLWTFAAYKILGKGLPVLYACHGLIVIMIAAMIATGFILMFHKVSGKYTRRILDMEGERFPIYRFMSAKGYVLIATMMSMGIALGKMPGVPEEFIASFYPGLGSGLAYGVIRYIIYAIKL